MNPDPSAWTDEDLAIRLARTYRWAGESTGPHPLSVAQHSLLVLALVEDAASAAGVTLTPRQRLRELLHDAEEGFIGFDPISPLKRALGEPFQWVSQRLYKAVARRYALPEWSAEDLQRHKLADRQAAAGEAVHCVGWSVQEVREVLDIDAPIPEVDPLAQRLGTEPWVPWTAANAAERFMVAVQGLLAEA